MGLGRRPLSWKRDGFLPWTSPLRRLARPTTTTLAAGRAILMELAHPSIAQGVADFDHFREEPARRARLTAMAISDVIHGTDAEAHAVGRRLRAVHGRVQGPEYSARDPALILWVHATFIDSLLVVGQRVHGPLSRVELEECYRHATRVGEVFGCPSELQPATIEDFDDYVAATVGSLEVSDVGRRLAHAVFWPDVPANRAPLLGLYRLAVFGTLPPPLREQFGYEWHPQQELLLDGGRAVLPLVAPFFDRLFFSIADGNGRGVRAALAVAGIRSSAPGRPR